MSVAPQREAGCPAALSPNRVQKRRNSVSKSKTTVVPPETTDSSTKESIMGNETADKKRKHKESASPKNDPLEPGEAWGHEQGKMLFIEKWL